MKIFEGCCLILLFCANLAYCQTDSLKGYGLFDFGIDKYEAKRILKYHRFNYDTVVTGWKIIVNKNLLRYEDKFTLGLSDDFNLEIILYFDQYHGNILYAAEVNIDEFCRDLEESQRKIEQLLDVLGSKYTYNFELLDCSDTLDFTLGLKPYETCRPKTKVFDWKFANGGINMVYDFSTFYERVDKNSVLDFSYTNNRIEPGRFEVRIYYKDLDLSAEYYKSSSEEYKKGKEEEERRIKKKL